VPTNRESLDINKSSLQKKGGGILESLSEQDREIQELKEKSAAEAKKKQKKYGEQLKTSASTSTISPIRTYESDVQASIQKKNISSFDIAVAENKRRVKREAEVKATPRNRTRFILVTGLILTLFAGAIFYSIFSIFSKRPETEKQLTISTPVLPNLQTEAVFSSLTKTRLINHIDTARETSLTPGGILYLNFQHITPFGKQPLSTEGFLSMVKKRDPSLLRSLSSSFMYGLHSFDGRNAFLIIEVNAYETAFIGMLGWERDMANDLAGVITSKPSTSQNNGFVDVVIRNRDVRVVQTNDQPLYYSFPDRHTLVITNNEGTLRELFERLSQARFTR
jgi:hypothetical protein